MNTKNIPMHSCPNDKEKNNLRTSTLLEEFNHQNQNIRSISPQSFSPNHPTMGPSTCLKHRNSSIASTTSNSSYNSNQNQNSSNLNLNSEINGILKKCWQVPNYNRPNFDFMLCLLYNLRLKLFLEIYG